MPAILSSVGLREILNKLGSSPDDIRAENLRNWASTIPGASRIEEVIPRERCRVAGVIQNVRIDPREGLGSIEATITDGSGEMVAKWLGRPAMAGIRLGMGLVLEGTAGVAPDGYLRVLNPEYELVPGPEHG